MHNVSKTGPEEHDGITLSKQASYYTDHV